MAGLLIVLFASIKWGENAAEIKHVFAFNLNTEHTVLSLVNPPVGNGIFRA